MRFKCYGLWFKCYVMFCCIMYVVKFVNLRIYVEIYFLIRFWKCVSIMKKVFNIRNLFVIINMCIFVNKWCKIYVF